MKSGQNDRNNCIKCESFDCLPLRIQIITDWSQWPRSARNTANDFWNDKKRIRFSASGGEMISNSIHLYRLWLKYCQTFVVVFSSFHVSGVIAMKRLNGTHFHQFRAIVGNSVHVIQYQKYIVAFYAYSIL